MRSKFSQLTSKSSLMAELLARHASLAVSRGTSLEGTVVRVTGRQVILDVGLKSDGIVEGREFEAVREFARRLSPGQKVTATVINPETDSGQILLSLRPAAQSEQWNRLEQALQQAKPVKVVGDRMTRGGLSVLIDNLAGFIPNSHLSSRALHDPTKLMGVPFEAQVVELDRDQQRVILSERSISEKELIVQQNEVLTKIARGEIFESNVVRLTPGGAIVRVAKDNVPLEGFLRAGPTLPAEGETVTVTVASALGGRLLFAPGQRLLDWEKIKQQYPPDSKVNATVSRITTTTVFVDMADLPGVQATIGISRLPAGTSVVLGEQRKCYVEGYDDKKQRVLLGVVLKAKPIGYK